MEQRPFVKIVKFITLEINMLYGMGNRITHKQCTYVCTYDPLQEKEQVVQIIIFQYTQKEEVMLRFEQILLDDHKY